MLRRKIQGTPAWLVLGALLGVAACSANEPCLVGADCASGACRADGTCAPVATTDLGTDSEGEDGSSSGDGRESDTTASLDDGTGDGTGGELCLPPNADGLIEREEMPLQAGLSATFRVAQGVPFDSAGTMVDGARQWDFDVMLTGDHQSIAETQALTGRWFEPLFPEATYASRLTDGDDLLGVFEATDTALLLRGVVSPTDGLDRTELAYDPPVTILAFPLWEGQSWTTDATVSGLAQGIAVFYTESYDGEVDASGVAITPYGELPVLRANVLLTRTVGVLITTVRTQSFVAECFGTVASLRSEEGVDEAEFGQAAELRRLAP